MYTRIMQVTALLFAIAAAGAAAQQSVTLNVPGTPENAPTALSGCLFPAGGSTSMPGSGGSSGTGPAGMNTDAANTGAFFTFKLGKKTPKTTPYSLVGVNEADVKKYGNTPVRVEGVLLPPPNPDAGAPVAVTSGKDNKKKTDKAPLQFRVTAIKQIPGSCGGR
jgi:hypothetical protein